MKQALLQQYKDLSTKLSTELVEHIKGLQRVFPGLGIPQPQPKKPPQAQSSQEAPPESSSDDDSSDDDESEEEVAQPAAPASARPKAKAAPAEEAAPPPEAPKASAPPVPPPPPAAEEKMEGEATETVAEAPPGESAPASGVNAIPLGERKEPQTTDQ